MTRRNQIFRTIEKVEDAFNRTQYDRSNRRSLSEQDYDDFDAAARRRARRKPTPQTVDAVKSILKKDNLVRYLRLRSDLRWARKRLAKMGRNPDDIWVIFND